MEKLEQAVKYIKSGEKTKGRKLLAEILQTEPKNEAAWLWMSAVVLENEQKKYCLEQVLKLNPSNPQAQNALSKIKKREKLDIQTPIPFKSKDEEPMNDGVIKEETVTQDYSTKIWVNPDSSIDKVTVLAEEALLIANPSREDANKIKSQIEHEGAGYQHLLAYKPKIIALKKITRVRANKHSDSMMVYYSHDNKPRLETVFYENAQVRNQVLAVLEKKLGSNFVRSVKKYNTLQAMMAPGVVMGIIVFFTYAFYVGAQEMASGQDPTITGRYRLLKQLIVWLVSIIGPTGILIVGGLLVVMCLVWLFKNIANPPIMMELSKRTKG